MNDKFSDELISAYLDGELTPDEQVAVERELRENPEARRTFDELRVIRSSLQSLPRHKLDEAFAERVLRRAERVMLSPSAHSESSNVASTANVAATNAPATSTPTSVSPNESSAAQAELRRWRRLFWVAASVAAMLFVALCLPPQFPGRNVAQHPVAPADQMTTDQPQLPTASLGKNEVANAPAALPKDSEPVDLKAGPAVPAAPVAAVPEAAAANAPSVAKDPKQAATDKMGATFGGAASVNPIAAPANQQKLESKKLADRDVGGAGMGGGGAGAGAQNGAALGTAAGQQRRSNDLQVRGRAADKAIDDKQVDGKLAAEKATMEKRSMRLSATDAAPTEQAKAAENQLRAGQALDAVQQQERLTEARSNEWVVVRMQLARGEPGEQKKLVDQLLAKNDIQFLSEATAGEAVTGRRALRHADREVAGTQNAERDHVDGERFKNRQRSELQHREAATKGNAAPGGAAPSNVEVVFIEAAPGQIAATLKEMSHWEGVRWSSTSDLAFGDVPSPAERLKSVATPPLNDVVSAKNQSAKGEQELAGGAKPNALAQTAKAPGSGAVAAKADQPDVAKKAAPQSPPTGGAAGSVPAPANADELAAKPGANSANGSPIAGKENAEVHSRGVAIRLNLPSSALADDDQLLSNLAATQGTSGKAADEAVRSLDRTDVKLADAKSRKQTDADSRQANKQGDDTQTDAQESSPPAALAKSATRVRVLFVIEYGGTPSVPTKSAGKQE